MSLSLALVLAVTLDVQPRTFAVPATLTVTWDAPSPAVNCVASGGWSGARPTSGTEQVAGVVGTTMFSLSCTGVTAPLTVSWAHPTTNTDGSAYTNPKHTEIFRASTAAGIPAAGATAVAYPATSFTYSGLPVGVYYFALKAVNQADGKSVLSPSVSRDVQAPTGDATPVAVTGSTTPPPPTGVVATATAAYAVKPKELVLQYILDGIVGSVPLGVPCDATRRMGTTAYHAVNRAKYVTWTTTRRPNTVVVQCGPPPAGQTTESESAPLDEGEP